RLGRVSCGGTGDWSFGIDLAGGECCDLQRSGFLANVASMARQSDGKIVISGAFTNVGGLARESLARLLPDATVDSTFNPNAGVFTALPSQQMCAVEISEVVLGPDNQVLARGRAPTLMG